MTLDPLMTGGKPLIVINGIDGINGISSINEGGITPPHPPLLNFLST